MTLDFSTAKLEGNNTMTLNCEGKLLPIHHSISNQTVSQIGSSKILPRVLSLSLLGSGLIPGGELGSYKSHGMAKKKEEDMEVNAKIK